MAAAVAKMAANNGENKINGGGSAAMAAVKASIISSTKISGSVSAKMYQRPVSCCQPRRGESQLSVAS